MRKIPVDKFTGRVNYSKLQRDEKMPNLLAVQLESYNDFLQVGRKTEARTAQGIESVFQTIFPIESTRGHLIMEYISYKTGEPKYGIEECQERGLSFSVPLKVRLRLVVKEEAEGATDQEMMIRDIQEQEVYLGELPMITDKGTFLINGAERVIVSQLHRSPGVFFSDEIHPNGRRLFRARIIPYRGSWVEFTTDINNILYVHIDRKRKQPATMLLRALGFQSSEEIIALFHEVETVKIPKPNTKKFTALEEGLEGRILAARRLPQGRRREAAGPRRHRHRRPAARGAAGRRASPRSSWWPRARSRLNEPSLILNTLRKDPTHTQDEALRRFYSLLRPGDPPNEEVARALFERLFFNEKRYDLAEVGRYKMNRRLSLDVDPKTTTLTPADFLAIIREMIGLFLGQQRDRRHRPLRQPSHPLGRRAAGQPVLGGPEPHGAHHQGAHEPGGQGEAAQPGRPGQRAHGLGGGPVVLRQQPAEPVHGPDQPAARADPQAAPERPRARRSAPRPRRLRGARRALHPLRAHVPDRDARKARTSA